MFKNILVLDITRIIIVDVFVVAVVSGMPIALDGTLFLVNAVRDSTQKDWALS